MKYKQSEDNGFKTLEIRIIEQGQIKNYNKNSVNQSEKKEILKVNKYNCKRWDEK